MDSSQNNIENNEVSQDNILEISWDGNSTLVFDANMNRAQLDDPGSQLDMTEFILGMHDTQNINESDIENSEISKIYEDISKFAIPSTSTDEDIQLLLYNKLDVSVLNMDNLEKTIGNEGIYLDTECNGMIDEIYECVDPLSIKESTEDEGIQSLPYTENCSFDASGEDSGLSDSESHKNKTSQNSEDTLTSLSESMVLNNLSKTLGDICLADLTNFSNQTQETSDDSGAIFNSCEITFSNNPECTDVVKTLKDQLYTLKSLMENNEKEHLKETETIKYKLNQLYTICLELDKILNDTVHELDGELTEEKINKLKSNLPIMHQIFTNLKNSDQKCEELNKQLAQINHKYQELLKTPDLRKDVEKLQFDLEEKENINKQNMIKLEQLEKSILEVKKEADVAIYEVEHLKSELNSKNLECDEHVKNISNLEHLKKLNNQEITRLKEIESSYIKLLGEHRCLNSKLHFLERDYTLKQETLINQNKDLENIIEKNKTTINDMTNIINNETQKYNEINEKNQNLQILFESLNKKLDDSEQRTKMIQMDNDIYKDQLLDKEFFMDHIHHNITNVFSIDEFLSKHIPDIMTKDSFTECFAKLRQRMLAMSQFCKTAECERKKVNNMEIECNILNRQVQQKESKLEEVTQKYKEKCQTIMDHNMILTKENNKLIERLKELEENLKSTEERDCESLQKYIQELKIEIVDKNAKISSLELHIESCCAFNRRKAQECKNELYEVKNQLKYARRECAQMREAQLKHSSNIAKTPNVETGVQTEEIQTDNKLHSLGIVERHKIRSLEERILKLEQDKIILKKVCTKRAETIKMLERN